MNRQQQEAIACLRTENRILREKLGQKRILLNVSQKRRLATAAAPLPRQLLREVGFRIVGEQEVYPECSFLDIGAVVYYLRAIPWLLNDFTVEKYRGRLLAMHKHIQTHGRFAVKDQKFLIEAVKL